MSMENLCDQICSDINEVAYSVAYSKEYRYTELIALGKLCNELAEKVSEGKCESEDDPYFDDDEDADDA